ncbi:MULTISPECIES: hypothetical protein [unclassified Curtobacterium]|uniref:hypothetical protein n=1 Tax=unclassified Curtobacterium TaxID=257496 RepID=UPI000D837EF6|nr:MULTISPECIES: hypothetical protein [unclassified Curtobacterium]PYY39152.1 hypothetical protein DEJ32_09470 [Curtobacterium sp. MCPF17_046]PYY48107.1 hypothetical protein DEI84_10505 [Curtobacterium sp. MCBD17_023]PZE87966.1 hypothetical protein DEI95_16195 [Curtobacterium sp. MCBD17_008]WIB16018.1 hypothetical protein DEJ34_02490 [Curtobacterium sp. MCPF17_050]
MNTTINRTAAGTDVTLDTDTVDIVAVLEAQAATSARAARAKLTWTLEGDDEWIANYGGYFGGSVDKRDGRYVASDTFGLVVGDFASLEDAQTALAGHLHVMLPSVIRPVA